MHRGSIPAEGEHQSPNEADPLSTALQRFDQGRMAEAAALFQQVLQSRADHPVALHHLGLIADQLGMPDRAIRLLRQALRAGGESAELLNDLGRLFVESKDVENGRRCFQRCIDRYPGSSLGYVSLAFLENQDGQFQKAESLYIAAIANADRTVEAEFNLATLQREWGFLRNAVAHYDALIRRHGQIPVFADGRARALLQQRQWRDGWQAYEARFLIDEEPAKINLDLSISRWQGESLAGKQLLVLYEQGIGDEVQFASCYADVVARAEHCTITCSPRLLPILRSFPEATFVAVAAEDRETWRPETESRFDFLIPAGSLPGQLRNHDSDFPGKPYLIPLGNAITDSLLHSPAGRVEAVQTPDQNRPFDPTNLRAKAHCRATSRRSEMATLSRAICRVGVSWWGGAVADQIQQRSIPFDIFQELFAVPDVEFVNLQHGSCDQQSKQELSRFENLRTYPIDPYRELEPWFDLLASLDLVISVDNSNVHFAGAVGVPTWLLLPDHPNWRWPADCQVAPWYAAVRLIRKSPDQNWSATMRDVSQQLQAYSQENRRLPVC